MSEGRRRRGADDTNLEVVQAEQIKIILAPLGLRCVAFGNVARLKMKSSSQDKQPYPWYDSFWLTKYQRAKDVIRRDQRANDQYLDQQSRGRWD